MCRKIVYHAGPSGGHIGEYKILYRIRLRFFWPKLHEDIKQWIKNCTHCIAYNNWCNRRQLLIFSWLVIIPFTLKSTVLLIKNDGIKIREVYKFNKEDVMKYDIQVPSKLDNREVGKFSYRARGLFQIIENLGNDSCKNI